MTNEYSKLKLDNIRNFVVLGNFLLKLSLFVSILVILSITLDVDELYAPLYNVGTSLQIAILSSLLVFSVSTNGIIDYKNKRHLLPIFVLFYTLISLFYDYENYIDLITIQFFQLHHIHYQNISCFGIFSKIEIILISTSLILGWLKHFKCKTVTLYLATFIPFNVLVSYIVGSANIVNLMSLWTAMITGFLAWGLLFKHTIRKHLRYLVADSQVMKIYSVTAIGMIGFTTLGIILLTNYWGIERFPPSWPTVMILTLWLGFLFVTIAMQRVASIALTNRKLNRKIHQLATTDRLTKVLNRHGLNEILDKRHHNVESALILCDIDDFKLINDTYGHDVGDIVLKTFADTIQNNSRVTDHIIRWGGEEFLILTTADNVESLKVFAEKIRSAIENMRVVGYPNILITASFGCSPFTKLVQFDEVVKTVDNNLYEAKKTGKNKVVCS